MKSHILATLFLCAIATWANAAEEKTAPADAAPSLETQISELVTQLNADKSSERDAAEKQLLELAGSNAAEVDHFLVALPKDNDQMPLAVRDRLTRIRRQVEERVAKAATGSTTVTLSAKAMPLAEVFKAIQAQTGNKLIDNREEQEGDGEKSGNVTIELKDEPFWSAMDQILDQAKLSVYSYGGEEALSIVARSDADGPRVGQAVYQGPLRMEILEAQAQRGIRQPKQQALRLQLEVAWEPRLRPIAISQPAADITATTDDGGTLAVRQPEASLDVEVPTGTQTAEIVVPFELPNRGVKKIAKLHGKLHALVPGRRAKFEFKEVAKAGGKTQSLGGVHVTLDEVRRNGAVWEIHMRFALDEANGSLEAHRDWVFQNLSYLIDKDGKTIENAGFETTRQAPNEVGVAYLFDVEDSLEGLIWVYESPAAIVDLPVEYELKDIELP